MATAEDGFDDFFGASYRRLVGQLCAVTGSLEDAEDCCQEAYARAAARWHTVRAYDCPEAWVRRVALNLASNRLRRLRRELAARVCLESTRIPQATLSGESVDLMNCMQRLSLRPTSRLISSLHRRTDR